MGHAKAKAGANGTLENGAPRGRKRSGPRLWVLPLWLTTVVVLTLLTFRRFLPGKEGGVRKPRSDIRPNESVELLYKLGHWHRRRHEDVEALVSFHWAKEVLQHQIGSLHSLVAVEILADIAETMDSQNSLWAMGEKLAVYEECLSIIESFDSGEVDRLLSRVSEFTEPLKNMGLGAISMNDVELELKIWEVSLRFCLATSCTDSVRHGELLIRVGVALSKQAEQDSGLIMQYYEKAEQILVKLQRQNSHWYAILVHNMGVVFGQQGDRNRELASYEKAVATYRGLKMTHTETFTSILYELASSRTDFGDKEGGREAFLEAERVFVQNPKLQSRMRSHYVGQYGVSRRAAGDLAGAIHAFEIALQVHDKAQTLRTESGRSAKRSLKEAEDVVASLPKEDRRQITRRIEVLRWPSEPETAEELEAGVYLQRAGR